MVTQPSGCGFVSPSPCGSTAPAVRAVVVTDQGGALHGRRGGVPGDEVGGVDPVRPRSGEVDADGDLAGVILGTGVVGEHQHPAALQRRRRRAQRGVQVTAHPWSGGEHPRGAAYDDPVDGQQVEGVAGLVRLALERADGVDHPDLGLPGGLLAELDLCAVLVVGEQIVRRGGPAAAV
jgi:hypothetical protein